MKFSAQSVAFVTLVWFTSTSNAAFTSSSSGRSITVTTITRGLKQPSNFVSTIPPTTRLLQRTRDQTTRLAAAGGGGGGGIPGTLETEALLTSLKQALDQLKNDVQLPTTLSDISMQEIYDTLSTAISIDGTAWLQDNAITSFLPTTPPSNDLIAFLTDPWHAAAITSVAAGAALINFIQSPDDFSQSPYQPGPDTYDPAKAAEFYSKRPWAIAKRILRLAYLTTAFNSGLLFDWLVLGKLFKDEEYTALRNAEPRRAKEALILCQQLGPTFIKLGQALSIRTDLIPEAYALELRQLQDAVPPFDSDVAYKTMEGQLGVRNINQIFSKLSEVPVASASIGQVYRGTLRSNGKDVAVKVQRPGILAEIALDLHVLRILTPIQTRVQNAVNGIETAPEDIATAVSLVDEWGRGFVAETDYRLEAENTINFEAAMQRRGLDAVCAPPVVKELVRDTVLVTEWVEGTRLDRDASPDVPRLCGVAINAYLTMLLDTGVLHCDPHPGNLLRTTDGKLCILDWGMTLRVPSDLQYSLLEFIAHINVEDYDAIPQDFINLGFSPQGVSAERLKKSGITEGLSFTFRQLSAGGGPSKIRERVKSEFQQRYGPELSDTELRSAARAEIMQRMEEQLASEGVDVKGVTNVMEEMSRRNRELFALPPYVLYVARAFSTLEGIGLSIDENYSIVQECYPYLARRLFTDRTPRAKGALKAMLGLAEVKEESTTAATGSIGNTGALSPGKLIEMSEGFASYTAATATVDRDGAGQKAATKEFAKLLLDPEGSTLQDILVDETARLGDAATRSVLRSAFVDSPPAKVTAAALKAPKDILARSEELSRLLPSPLREILIDRPAKLPELLDQLLSPTVEDEKVLASAEELRVALGSRLIEGNIGVRSKVANQLVDGAAAVPSVPDVTPAVRSIASDKDTRQLIIDQLPGAEALGRRLGAGLLRRAAYRAEKSTTLPEETRRALIEANNALADALEPKLDKLNREDS